MSHKIFRSVSSLFLALAVLGSGLNTQVARAAGPWYVTPTGDDNNDCLSPDTPCVTINGAIGKAASGDTINVAMGTYTEVGIPISLTLSGGWNAAFTAQSGMSTIDGQGLPDHSGISTSDYADPNITVSVDHFIITNAWQGIHNGVRSALTVSNSTIIANMGVGIHVTAVGLTLNNSSVIGNGTGIHVDGGNVILNNSIISENNERGILVGGSTVSLNNSIVSDNTASSSGGGVHISVFGTLNINNSTIANNTSPFGGGIYLIGGATLNVNNSTINGNVASSSGGGISLDTVYGSNTVTLRNTILANNTAATGPDCSGIINTSDYNIIGNTTGCTVTAETGDQFNTNPLLSSYPVGAGYFTLLTGSPAIDAGNPSTCLSIDQRGMTRPQGSACDMGAYESVAFPGTANSFGYLDGSNQRAVPQTAFPRPFVVYVLDGNGSAVPGVTVTFTAPESGPSGSFADSGTNTTEALSDSSGIALSPIFTANSQSGSYNVTATVSGLADSITFAVSNAAWFVAPTGNDSNSCNTTAAPCLTINAAIGKAANGETVYIAGGTYTSTSDFVVNIDKNITLSGSWDPTFTSRSLPSIIDGQSARPGIFVNGGVATIDSFSIENGFSCSGGGILNHGTLTLLNSTLKNNKADNPCGAGGGAIWSYGTLVVNDTTISNNIAIQGGGIYVSGGSANLSGVTLKNNTSNREGGGIYISGSASNPTSVTIHDSALSSNIANYDGGGIYVYQSNLTINNSAITGNLTKAPFTAGGGIFNGDSELTVNNSTISNNSTYKGGGIYMTGTNSTSVNLNSTTIAYNITSIGGGVINDGNNSSFTIRNSILARNTALIEGPECIFGLLSSGGYNILGNTSECNFTPASGDLTDIDALLVPLVGLPGYHPLLQNSPAIDAGNPVGCTDQNGDPLTTDQRGVARDGTCDIGAYEYTTPGPAVSLTVAGGDNQVTTTTSTFPNLLQAAALDSQGSPVSGITVDFAAPGSGPSGTFTDTGTNTTSASTDEGGVATTSVFTANDQAGAYTVSASAAGLGSVNFNLEQIIRPTNDNFANARIITSLPFTDSLDNTQATIEAEEPSNCYPSPKSVWYSFTPTTNGVASIDMVGSSFTDTILNIYQEVGSGIGGLSFLNCAYYGEPATLRFQAGVKYYIQAGSIDSGGGDLHLNLQLIPPPANDNFSDATTIGALPFSDSVDITGATTESGEPQFCTAPNSVWYSFTPTFDGAVRADTVGSMFGDTNLIVYQAGGSGIGDLIMLQCASGEPASFRVQAGITYYFQVGTSFSIGGELHLNLQESFPPMNDNFSDATTIDALPFNDSVNNADALREPGETNYCLLSKNTVWYTFTATADGALRADTAGSSFSDTTLSVYQAGGPGIGDLVFLQCGSFGSAVTFSVEAGVTYYFQAGSVNSAGGDLRLNLEEASRPANDRFDSATVIPLPLPFDDTVDTSAASIEDGEPTPACAYYGLGTRSIWYAFTAERSGSISASIPGASFTPVVAVYTATALSNPTEVSCQNLGQPLTFRAKARTTYYFQVNNLYPWEQGGSIQFHLEVTPPPVADFHFSPTNPTIFDTIQFYDNSYDPAQAGIQSYLWIFGDGSRSTDPNPTHQYAKDGNYTVRHTITTVDGRKATIARVVRVKTNQVIIDIKPGTKINRIVIGPGSDTTVLVAILSTRNFNAPRQVDRNSLTFGRTGDEDSLNRTGSNLTPNCLTRDVNRDGRQDLVCRFLIGNTGFQPGDTVGILKGMTARGVQIQGRDSVVIRIQSYP